jgi:hypothetical protein
MRLPFSLSYKSLQITRNKASTGASLITATLKKLTIVLPFSENALGKCGPLRGNWRHVDTKSFLTGQAPKAVANFGGMRHARCVE